MMKKTPTWLSYDEDGNADVTLSRPMNMEGAQVSTIRMREPTLMDQLAVENLPGSDTVQEATLFANLAGLAPADVQRLPLRDYRRLQAAFVGFID